MTSKAKNPSSILYWNDLENDAQLKTCSLAAKGLWDHHMLPIAARSAEPGVILLGNHPSRLDGDLPMLLARSVGESPETIAILLRELVDSGAASVDAAGRVYNRRMVREEGVRKARADAGRKGGTTPKTKKAKPEQTASGEPSNDGSKIRNGQSTASGGETKIIPPKSTMVGKQTPKQDRSKTEPSSDFMLQSSSDVTTTSSPEAAAPLAAAREAAAEDDLAFPPSLKRAPDGPQAAMIQRQLEDRAHALWLEFASKSGVARGAAFLNSAIRPMLAARLAECGGIDGWQFALEQARLAEFLRKDGRWQWWFDLDWMLKPNNFSRLIGGRYAERHADRDDGRPTVSTGLAGLAEAGSR